MTGVSHTQVHIRPIDNQSDVTPILPTIAEPEKDVSAFARPLGDLDPPVEIPHQEFDVELVVGEITCDPSCFPLCQPLDYGERLLADPGEVILVPIRAFQ